MKLRIWTTTVEPARAVEYEKFAQEVSLPMFRAQHGFRGVLMGRNGASAVVISLWEDDAAIAALDISPGYQATVKQIGEAGFLGTEQDVGIFDLHLLDLASWGVAQEG